LPELSTITSLKHHTHPDDDIISMGCTSKRLVYQGHEVHVGYQTSGNIAIAMLPTTLEAFVEF